MNAAEHQSAPRLLAIRSVTDRTSLSEPTIRRMIEAGTFPKPIQISRNRIAWPEPRVDEWINKRIEEAA